jgi:molybdopterin-guanine dinucleotide biosynthesis protein A
VELREITLAVLAGGAGSRMRQPKATLEVRGEPLLEFLLRQLDWPGPTLLVTAPGREHPPGADGFDREVSDAIAGQGPLRGMLTALQKIETNSVIAIGVDMPAIQRRDLEWFVGEFKARPEALGIMGRSAGTIEPLPCLLTSTAAELLEHHFATGRRSLRGLIDDARVLAIDADTLPSRVWLNVNTPEDWKRFLADLPD